MLAERLRDWVDVIGGKVFVFLRKSHERRKQRVYRAAYTIDPSFRFNGNDTLFYGAGKLTIGRDSYLGSRSVIQVAEGTEVKIGRNCALSHNVRINTSSRIADSDLLQDKVVRRGSVLIGDGVWIGYGVYVGPGITIGDGAVVGANSVVTHDVPPQTIVGGVPARTIRAKFSRPDQVSVKGPQ